MYMIEDAGKQVSVVKRSGEIEPFSEAKLRRPLEKA
jgi:transcriptional regulator NrdR family protein